MKYIRTTHWVDLPNQQGLLFFAQVLSECLFDYTLDTYKPSALNIRVLCIEALQTIDNIKIGLIKKSNIDAVIDELLWSLNGDFVARKMIANRLNGIIDNIRQYRNNLKKLKEVILLLYHFLDNRKYLAELQSTLLNIVPVNKEKENIYRATRSFVTELINYGYTISYIYYSANKFFFNRKKKFKHIDPRHFFEIFNFKEKTFTVVYKVSMGFKEFENVGENLDFKIVDSFSTSGLPPREREYIETKESTETFIVFDGVKAIEDNVARIRTEIPLFKISNLFSFYHHKENLKVSELALVLNRTDRVSLLREEPRKSIIKKADIKPNVAARKAKDLLSSLDLAPNTLYRIVRAIDLHSISLTTEQVENKLLNIWTALETLVPKDVESGVDRIAQIINALMPFQTLKYVNKLIEQAGNDFLHYSKSDFANALDSVKKGKVKSEFHSLAILIMAAESEKERGSVYQLLGDYPLLRFRLFILNRALSSGKAIDKLVKEHRQKVEWQIRRIYRVRNLIVHSGVVPSYTNILVESLHNYFDDFLNYIIDNASKEKRIQSTSEAIINAEIDVDIFLKNLKMIGGQGITLENFELAI